MPTTLDAAAPKKILIIEDEKAMAHALEVKLGKAGFATKVIFNGEDGLALLLEETFDLALIDLIMPKMDGFQVLEKLKEKNANIPIIVLSNLSQNEDQERVKSLGTLDYFVKSNTTLAFIVEHIKQILA